MKRDKLYCYSCGKLLGEGLQGLKNVGKKDFDIKKPAVEIKCKCGVYNYCTST